MRIDGENVPGYAYPWSGAIINLGESPMQPVDLGTVKKLLFDARGEGKSYRARASAESLGRTPAIVDFKATAEWQRQEIPLSAFRSLDPQGTMAFFIGGPGEPGPFWLAPPNASPARRLAPAPTTRGRRRIYRYRGKSDRLLEIDNVALD